MSTPTENATTTRTTGGVDRTERHPAQYLALTFGIVYTLIGILGFFVTGIDGFASPEGDLLLGFEVNPLHNIIHLLLGLVGLGMWKTLKGARNYGWLLAIVFVPTFLYGLAVAGSDDPANFLALNVADNLLHLATAAVGLAMALWPARKMAR